MQRSGQVMHTYVMRCAIWYHLYNLNNVKNTHGGLLLLVKSKSLLRACNFTKSNTPPWVFFTFFKLYKWYQIAPSITYMYYTYIFEPATLLKVALFHGCFSRFLNCTNGTKLRSASHICIIYTFLKTFGESIFSVSCKLVFSPSVSITQNLVGRT